MRSTSCLVALFLAVPIAYAQHRGAMAGGAPAATARAGARRPARQGATGRTNRGIYGGRPFVRSALGRGYGYGLGYGWPYGPLWDYDSATQLYYGDESAGDYPEGYPLAEGAVMPAPPITAGPAWPAQVASSVIHDYNFPKQPASGAGQKTEFTIVLKDGSMRSAVASWISGGRLHYLDSHARQQVLSADVIDRDATEQANEAKNLSLVLPPG